MENHRFSRWIAPLVVLAALAGPFLVPTRAQRNQPIYPAYDGFLKNADGSYTLAFAYFSHNAEVVKIPPGADNVFEPTPADRQQPTTFRPGHNRYQCLMVVDAKFDGKLRWTLTYGGVTTSTSQNMLQSNWYLVDGVQIARAVDFAKVPRGVCLNRAPAVTILGLQQGRGGGGGGRGGGGSTSVAMGETLNLFGSVEDEGLPRSAPLVITWTQVSGPGTVKFSNPSEARTYATFSAPGAYQLELKASDSEFSPSSRVNVTVTAAAR